MIVLSEIAKQEKNKLATNSAFLVLLDIELSPETVYLCYNTEDIEWNTHTYQAFPFEIGEVTESQDGSEPSVELKVSNVSQVMQYYVEQGNGGNGTGVVIRVVNTENLTSASPELEERYVIQKCTVDEQWITFTLGCEYSSRTRRPLNRYMKNSCRFKYKGIRCGYNGSLASCKHTLEDCRLHNNSKRFGAFPGIDQGGVYIG